jgi:hypothetical protein
MNTRAIAVPAALALTVAALTPRPAQAYDGAWTQLLPPAICLTAVVAHIIAARSSGQERELRAVHDKSMARLTAGDTLGAIRTLGAADSVFARMSAKAQAGQSARELHETCVAKRAQLVEARATAPRPALAQQPATEPAPPVSPAPAVAQRSIKAFESSDGLWGYRDASGRAAIAPRYRMANEFSACGLADVVDDSGWLCIDTAGAPRYRPMLFDNGPDPLAEGLCRFTSGGKVGFVDSCGTTVVPARFSFAAPFANGNAAFCEECRPEMQGEHTAMVGGRWGLVDRSGRIVVEARYEQVQAIGSGKVRALDKGTWVIIDMAAPAR